MMTTEKQSTSLFEAMEHSPYAAWCMPCCQAHHPDMLTGYSLRQLPCDRCGRMADLAMVKIA